MIKIMADSTCDLSKEWIEKYAISIIPLHILLGEKEYLDGADILPQDIYQWSDANKMTPKTSAASIEDVIHYFEPYVKEESEIICFAISEEMSTTANVMRLAAAELEAEDKIYVINSENLSTGIGLLVLQAAKMAAEGADAKTIVSKIEALKPQVRASFVVDTLVYLHRGGRCSGLAALAGGALKLHPKIVVEGGKMKPDKKYRGTMQKVILSYVKDLEAGLQNAMPDKVFITHSGCTRELVEQVRAYLESLGYFEEIIETMAGGVISSHCGPGTLGVLFIEKMHE